MMALPLTILLGGVTMLLVSLPLIYRKIPMNRFYGIRIPAAFESDERWYEINAFGGRRMAAWSWLVIVMGAAGFFVPERCFFIYVIAGGSLTLLGVFAPVISIFRRFRRR